MAVSQQEETDRLNFEDFRRLVGASAYTTRVAIAVLGLRPETGTGDARTTVYRREWVEQVRDYLAKRARGEA